MIANTRLFWVLAGFFVLADVIYIVWNVIDFNSKVSPTQASSGFGSSPVEWVGAVGLGLTAILASFIAFYLGRVHKAQGGELPQDTLTANIDDGDPEQGFFSPWSWWPIMLAGSGALLFLGVAIGPWIAFIAVGLLLISLVGWTYEYYRGNFAS